MGEGTALFYRKPARVARALALALLCALVPGLAARAMAVSCGAVEGVYAGHFRYDAYGNFRTEAHPGNCNADPSGLTCNAPLTYTGHLYDQESNLYYFGARYYDPETGRFLTNDPVAGDALNPPSLHKYLYAYDSPMVYTDPWGEYALDDLNERFDPNPNNMDDFMRLTSLVNQATRHGGGFESYRSDYEAIRAGAGEFRTRDFKRDARTKMFELYSKIFGSDEAQDNRGFIITEGPPQSLRVNAKTMLKDAATNWELNPKERAVAFGGAVWGIAGPVLVQAAKYGNPLTAGYFAYKDMKEAFKLGEHIHDVGWSEFSQQVWAGIKKPFEEGDTFHASAETGQALFMIYGMARPFIPSGPAEEAATAASATRTEVLSEGATTRTPPVVNEPPIAPGESTPHGFSDVAPDNYSHGPFEVPEEGNPNTGGTRTPRLGPKGVDPNHHNANVTVRDADGNIIHHERIVSGNMTPEEKALPFPKNTLASHTEARAMRDVPLEEGQTMTITGENPPCPSCKGAMNKRMQETGGTIRYQWREGGNTQKWPPDKR